MPKKLREIHRVDSPPLRESIIYDHQGIPAFGFFHSDTKDPDNTNKTLNPSYWFRKKHGMRIPPLEYLRDIHTLINIPGTDNSGQTVHGRSSGWFGGMEGRAVQNGAVGSLNVNAVKYKAVRALYNRIRYTDFDILVSAGEFHQTLSLISHTARRLADGFLSLKKGDIGGFAKAVFVKRDKKGRRILRGIHSRNSSRKLHTETYANAKEFAAGAWLEATYGWKPLINDVVSAAEAFAQTNLEEQILLEYRVRKSSTHRAQNLSTLNDTLWKVSEIRDQEQTELISLAATILHPTDRQQAGLGLSDISTVAWELLPYSFVVDWFAPVGDYLRALTATAGLYFLDGSTTSQQYARDVVKISSGQTIPGFPYLTSPLIVYSERYRMERQLIYDFPDPLVIIHAKTIYDALSFSHVTSAVALLSTAFK